MANLFWLLTEGESIGYYFQNWNSDVISISAVMAAIILLSGYFYGRVFQRFCRQLEDADTTVLGVLFIFAVFQALIFWSVSAASNSTIAYWVLLITLIFSPFLCLFTWSNIIPSWKHLASLVAGIVITWALCWASSKMTTNNIYFDSISYLSQTIESSQSQIFGRITYPSGYVHYEYLDVLHDYNGYCYFWGMILKYVQDFGIFKYNGLFTPIYIWSATMLYGMCLASLAVSCVNVLYKDIKWKWKGFVLTIALLSPFYTNYWNTTLGFFGNTIRTISVGMAMLLVYLFIKKRAPILLVYLIPVYTAGMCFSSTCFFLSAFITMGLFFTMCYTKERRWKNWIGFILSCLPIFHYALLIFLSEGHSYWLITGITVFIIGVLCLIAWLIRSHLSTFCKGGMILLPIVFVVLVVLSFVQHGDYNMGYFFASRSLDDMTVNMTSHLSTNELIRNILFYALLALMYVNFKKEFKFKVFILILILLVLNPLVEPAIANNFTAGVYSRSFDLLTNPFTIAFIGWNFDQLLANVPVNLVGTLGLSAAFLFLFGIPTLTTVPSRALLPEDEEAYNWKTKVTVGSEDMYNIVQKNISSNTDRPLVLCQDVSMKGYVTGIRMDFTSTNYRDALADPANTDPAVTEMVNMLYPTNRFDTGNAASGESIDFTKLSDIVKWRGCEYLVISNTMSTWDERGWFDKAYQSLVNTGQGTVVYENDEWALIEINKNWEHVGKHPDRYWVHMYE